MQPVDLIVLVAALGALAASVTAAVQARSASERAREASELAGAAGAAAREGSRRQDSHAAALLARLDSATREAALLGTRMDSLRADVSSQLAASRDSLDRRFDELGRTVGGQLAEIRTDNARQLEAVRATVDERLTKTLNDRLTVSFRQINDQLEAVHRGLGDMQGLAAGVGDLRRVLSNVKTRGILGEVQLGAILSEILVPEQYETNVVTKPGSTERVEFAVRLPVEGDEPIYLPIDAKFPGDTYAALRDAADAGDPAAVTAARRRLEATVRAEARDIAEKYLAVPHTTNFAVMFLPFEGLYAEVVSMPGLVEALQRDYRVNVAGPSTMAALLNSLQLSYQTFRLQRRTDEVLRVLQEVKAELPRYQEALRRAKRQIDTASGTVESIITTRTNVMERRLRTISVEGEGGGDDPGALPDPGE